MTTKEWGTRSKPLGRSPISGSITKSIPKVVIQAFFCCTKMPPERTRGHIKRNTIRAHFNSTRDSFINLSWFLLSRLKRGFAKYVFLLMLDLSTQTWFQSLKNISFFIWSTFNKQKWTKHFSKVNIPMGLHGNRLPSIFMLYFECACLQKKRGVATKLSDICAKNSKKKDMSMKTLDS